MSTRAWARGGARGRGGSGRRACAVAARARRGVRGNGQGGGGAGAPVTMPRHCVDDVSTDDLRPTTDGYKADHGYADDTTNRLEER